MSGTDFYKGTITRIPETEGLNFSDGIDKLRSLGYVIDECNVDVEDEWVHTDTKLLWFKGTFFHMERVSLDIDDGLLSAQPIHNGYNFELIYYNGGCSFDEALEAAIDNIE